MRSITHAVLMLALLANAPAAALTFTVDSLGDLPDLTPGDGVCFNSAPPFFQPVCTLRAAIEEANGSPGLDTIRFSSGLVPDGQGALVIAPGSALPGLLGPVVIDGTTAPGYQSSDPEAIPVVYVDGTSAASSGLRVDPGAFGSTILGLGIVNFLGHGILLDANEFGGVEDLRLEGTHIGVFRGTTPAGNGDTGIFGTLANDNVIGASCDLTGCSGRGNVISANGGDGISLNGDDNVIAGNRIGTNAAGTSTTGFGNGGFGVEIAAGSTGNRVGDQGTSFGNPVASGNLISGNAQGGIWIRGDQNDVYANYVGTDVTGTLALGNLGEGAVQIDGSLNTIGDGGVGGNLVGGNDDNGIRLGFSTSIPADFNTVMGNWVGTNQQGDDLGNAGVGIVVIGDFNTVGAFGWTEPNTVGFNDAGVAILGDDNVVQANYIGTDDMGGDRGNGLYGVLVTNFASDTKIGAAHGVSDVTLPAVANEIAFNVGVGLAVDQFATAVSVRGNSIHENTAWGIDLDFDGRTTNDIGDLDFGPNDLQNFPEFDSQATGYNGNTGQVEVRYRVDSFTNESDYPLQIDFYLADAAGLAGETWFASDLYDAGTAGLFRSVAFPAPPGLGPSSQLVATATDFGRPGDTSEFSDPIFVPEPGVAAGLAVGALLVATLPGRRRPA